MDYSAYSFLCLPQESAIEGNEIWKHFALIFILDDCTILKLNLSR